MAKRGETTSRIVLSGFGIQLEVALLARLRRPNETLLLVTPNSAGCRVLAGGDGSARDSTLRLADLDILSRRVPRPCPTSISRRLSRCSSPSSLLYWDVSR